MGEQVEGQETLARRYRLDAGINIPSGTQPQSGKLAVYTRASHRESSRDASRADAAGFGLNGPRNGSRRHPALKNVVQLAPGRGDLVEIFKCP